MRYVTYSVSVFRNARIKMQIFHWKLMETMVISPDLCLTLPQNKYVMPTKEIEIIHILFKLPLCQPFHSL